MTKYSKTVVYYTANTEDPDFEAKIVKNILDQKGDLPLISVSQKKMDLGENICVGDVGHSYLNEYRQMLAGIKAAKTPYIVFAESDFLYPKSYFSFEPTGSDLYRYNNVWIVYKNPRLFSYRRKDNSIGAQIGRREFLIDILEKFLDGAPEWYDGEFTPRDKNGIFKKDVFRIPFTEFGDNTACISFKTGSGLRNYTTVMRGRGFMRMKLPYWGDVADLRKKYFGA